MQSMWLPQTWPALSLPVMHWPSLKIGFSLIGGSLKLKFGFGDRKIA
jgi:hypothetical protein